MRNPCVVHENGQSTWGKPLFLMWSMNDQILYLLTSKSIWDYVFLSIECQDETFNIQFFSFETFFICFKILLEFIQLFCSGIDIV